MIARIVENLLYYFKKIKVENKHLSYNDYILHQKKKTTDPNRVEKWLNEQWDEKCDGFAEIFFRNKKYFKECTNAICLGSRTGQEVKALLDMGIDAIGIDLVEFPPYTKIGDIHDLQFKPSTFDFVFTNIMDHALYLDKFCSEIERICKNNGIIMIHITLGDDIDEFSEIIVYNPSSIINKFNNVNILSNKKIHNKHDAMDWEIIMKKK
tara:strand:- start:515 stop:1141 length:627 start_codon:yes stop_codon:yes gene_type:complete